MAQIAACDRAYQQNAEAHPDGNGYSYDPLRAMSVTDLQRTAYETLFNQADEAKGEIYSQGVSVPDLSSYLSFMYSAEAVGIENIRDSQDMQADIDAAVARQVPPEVQAAIK